MEEIIIKILILILIFVISSLPLYFAVKVIGGRTNLIRTMLVVFLISVMTVIISIFFFYGNIIIFFLTVWIYRESFKLKWLKAFLVFFIQFIFIILMIFLLSLFNISLMFFKF